MGATWPASMAGVSLAELIETQAIGWWRADARLTQLVAGRIWTAVPATAVYPFVLIEGFAITPWNRLRGYGRTVTFQARAQSQVKGDYEAHRIADQLAAVIDGRDAELPPAKRSLWNVDDAGGTTFTDLVAGITTYHRTTIVRVRVQV